MARMTMASWLPESAQASRMLLGAAGAVIAVLAWAHSSPSAVFSDVPLTDVLILLIGLPLTAAVAGWLLAGREPEAIARQPLD